MTDWFETLTGFREMSWTETRAHLSVEGAMLRSRVNGRNFGVGMLETPSVRELRTRALDAATGLRGRLQFSTVAADVAALHRDSANQDSLFQVASQFNLLEMVGPDLTPEDGVTRYATDPTQGPACAIAAGAATLFRNYFVPLPGGEGQTATRQIDCLGDIARALGNDDGSLWTMRNGYALATTDGLAAVAGLLADMTGDDRNALRDLLRVGLHSDVEVTTGDSGHPVTQVFCSALPVAYSSTPSHAWEPFARLILEGAYEATLWAGILNAQRTGSRVVYLTRLGGGAFGNDPAWIDDAMERAVNIASGFALDVRLVSRPRFARGR